MSELVSTARRRELGAALRRIREQYGLNGQDMARAWGSGADLRRNSCVAGGSFHIVRYPEGSPVGYAQHVTAGELLEDRAVLAEFGQVQHEIAEVALDETRSRDLIARVTSEYERQGVAPAGVLGGQLARVRRAPLRGVAQESEATGGLSVSGATMAG